LVGHSSWADRAQPLDMRERERETSRQAGRQAGRQAVTERTSPVRDDRDVFGLLPVARESDPPCGKGAGQSLPLWCCLI
jgi:hypothetical protein